MQTYVLLGRLTTQAKKNMAGAMKSREQVVGEFEKKGVKVTDYQTLGPFDVVAIVESPSEELVMKFSMTAQASGDIEFQTLRAFTMRDLEKVQKA